jgi:chromosome segregation ATPase
MERVDYKSEYYRLKDVIVPKYRLVISRARDQLTRCEDEIEALRARVAQLEAENESLRRTVDGQKEDLREALEIIVARDEEAQLGDEIAEIDKDIVLLSERLGSVVGPVYTNAAPSGASSSMSGSYAANSSKCK